MINKQKMKRFSCKLRTKDEKEAQKQWGNIEK